MKHLIGTKVKVVKATDETFDPRFLNKTGIVIIHDANGAVGNTNDDPMHTVKFPVAEFTKENLSTIPVNNCEDDGQFLNKLVTAEFVKEDFWYEELEPVT